MEEVTGSPYKAIENKVRFHRKRAEFHKRRANEWDRILAQIQALQRQEQPMGREAVKDEEGSGDAEAGGSAEAAKTEAQAKAKAAAKITAAAKAKAKAQARAQAKAKAKAEEKRKNREKAKLEEGRANYAREMLQKHAEEGILPVEIRRLANEAGFSTPTNYPYKLLTRMVEKSGTARKDEAGKYYPVNVDEENDEK